MVSVEQISGWIGRDVVDAEDEKVGKLEDVFYAVDDHDPAFVSVKSGLFGRGHVVAPLAGATLTRDVLRLSFTKQVVKDAPEAPETGRLTAEEAQAVAAHYSLAIVGDEGADPQATRYWTQEGEAAVKRAEATLAETGATVATPGAATADSRGDEGAPDTAAVGTAAPAPGEQRADAGEDDGVLGRLLALERRVAALEDRG